MSPDMPQKLPDKVHRLRLTDIFGVDGEIQADMPAPRADRQRRDGGELPPAGMMPDDRGASLGRPCAAHGGDQEIPGFVYEGEMGAQPEGVFFRTGQVSLIQALIFFSLRAKKRRSGFWQLQPRLCKRRPT